MQNEIPFEGVVGEPAGDAALTPTANDPIGIINPVETMRIAWEGGIAYDPLERILR